MHTPSPILSPADSAMDTLCDQLRHWSGRHRNVSDWPGESLKLCGQAGVYRWFLPESQGGLGWSESDQARGYFRLAHADLCTTFIITQYMGAIRRIAGSANEVPRQCWLDRLTKGELFGTVGISHLTTSRRHLKQPALRAKRTDAGFVLEGMSPWVTGAPHADVLVIGATLDDGQEILAAVDADQAGIKAGRGCELVALSASCTDKVEFDHVSVKHDEVLAGPETNVLQSGIGANPGGLQTSTLALGLAQAAIDYLADESSRREDLRDPAQELARELTQWKGKLLEATEGQSGCDPGQIRGAANRLVLRATQAALTAAKGAGFVEGHPVGRWCREALFFLVWSCPQPVAQAHLCELAFGPES